MHMCVCVYACACVYTSCFFVRSVLFRALSPCSQPQIINQEIEEAKKAVQAAVEEGGKSHAIVQAKVGTDGKMLKSVVQALGKEAPGAALMVVSEEGGKGVAQAVVPKELHDRIKANEWLKAALDAVCLPLPRSSPWARRHFFFFSCVCSRVRVP